MQPRALALLACTLCLAGCGSSAATVLVHVAVAPGTTVARLDARVLVGDTARASQSLTTPDLGRPLRLIVDGAADLVVQLSGRDGGQRALRGQASVHAAPGRLVEVTVTLSGDAPLNWAREASGSSATLRAVWGAGHDLFAVGDFGTVLHGAVDPATAAITWAALTTPRGSGAGAATLYAVGGNGSDDVVIGGDLGCGLYVSRDAGAHLAEISRCASGDTPSRIAAVTGSGNGRVIVAGTEHVIAVRDRVDGAFAQQQGPPGSDFTALWTDVDARVLVVDIDNELWLSQPGAESFSDTAHTSDGTGLLGVWATAIDAAIAVGGGGRVLRWNGSALAAAPSGVDARLNGVWGAGTSEIYAVGDGGVVLRSSDAGQSWTRLDVPATEALLAVWGNRLGDIYVVGEGGVILHGQ